MSNRDYWHNDPNIWRTGSSSREPEPQPRPSWNFPDSNPQQSNPRRSRERHVPVDFNDFENPFANRSPPRRSRSPGKTSLSGLLVIVLSCSSVTSKVLEEESPVLSHNQTQSCLVTCLDFEIIFNDVFYISPSDIQGSMMSLSSFKFMILVLSGTSRLLQSPRFFLLFLTNDNLNEPFFPKIRL